MWRLCARFIYAQTSEIVLPLISIHLCSLIARLPSRDSVVMTASINHLFPHSISRNGKQKKCLFIRYSFASELPNRKSNKKAESPY